MPVAGTARFVLNISLNGLLDRLDNSCGYAVGCENDNLHSYMAIILRRDEEGGALRSEVITPELYAGVLDILGQLRKDEVLSFDGGVNVFTFWIEA